MQQLNIHSYKKKEEKIVVAFVVTGCLGSFRSLSLERLFHQKIDCLEKGLCCSDREKTYSQLPASLLSNPLVFLYRKEVSKKWEQLFFLLFS
jgi:hypothetical protein